MARDFLYTTTETRTEGENDFHRRRRAFMIYKDEVHYVPAGSDMSHWELAVKIGGIEKEEFNTLCRGYALDGDLYFYKGNFTYDEELVKYAENYFSEIKRELGLSDDMKIFFGLKMGEPGGIWPPEFQYK